MKKRLMAVFVVAGMLAAFLAMPTVANATAAETKVTGVITDSGVPTEGAEVTVICGAFTEKDTTDKFGSYLVTFKYSDCPPGSTVKVTAKKGDKTGSKTGRVVGVTTKLNIALVNVDIPEYGLIGAILATGAGAGALIYTRRRFAEGQAQAV
ncbi:MAG TPA: hypothetical protein VFZ58_04435 [Candidatus Saccharimonadales bacterium]